MHEMCELVVRRLLRTLIRIRYKRSPLRYRWTATAGVYADDWNVGPRREWVRREGIRALARMLS